jgi:hypothetical protein
MNHRSKQALPKAPTHTTTTTTKTLTNQQTRLSSPSSTADSPTPHTPHYIFTNTHKPTKATPHPHHRLPHQSHPTTHHNQTNQAFLAFLNGRHDAARPADPARLAALRQQQQQQQQHQQAGAGAAAAGGGNSAETAEAVAAAAGGEGVGNAVVDTASPSPAATSFALPPCSELIREVPAILTTLSINNDGACSWKKIRPPFFPKKKMECHFWDEMLVRVLGL